MAEIIGGYYRKQFYILSKLRTYCQQERYKTQHDNIFCIPISMSNNALPHAINSMRTYLIDILALNFKTKRGANAPLQYKKSTEILMNYKN